VRIRLEEVIEFGDSFFVERTSRLARDVPNDLNEFGVRIRLFGGRSARRTRSRGTLTAD
jgi:hypothetical protein